MIGVLPLTKCFSSLSYKEGNKKKLRNFFLSFPYARRHSTRRDSYILHRIGSDRQEEATMREETK